MIARLGGDTSSARQFQAQALVTEPTLDDAALELARLLNAEGKHAEAIRSTAAAASNPRPTQALLAERARAWQMLDRPDERLAERRRIAALYPGKAVNSHNLASALGDAGHAEEAEAEARNAIALGSQAPETRLVLARALQSQSRIDEADAAFAAALALRPGYFDALRDRAQLAWMAGSGIEPVLARIDADARGLPPSSVAMLKSAFLASAGMAQEGHDLMLAAMDATDPQAQATAATLALQFDPARALDHARRASALAPNSRPAMRQLADALLANRQANEALALLDPLLAQAPLDQGLIAARWAAWRLLGDARADELYDYDRLVCAAAIEAPPGWANVAEYLANLLRALEALHGFRAHPLDQSLRDGTQTASNLLLSDNPALRAFPEAIAPVIEGYLKRLGDGHDVLRARRGNGRRFAGMWSVRLRPGGRHLPHVHPQGWISSAFYVDLPDDAAAEEDKEGWLAFGQPGMLDLDAQFHVRPQAGTLALFPSYMWHATVPFTANGLRTTVAFDIVPAVPGA
ncbi:MAG: putative 2OG-Fe(II) oxygenase [Novosphingobium sp.]